MSRDDLTREPNHVAFDDRTAETDGGDAPGAADDDTVRAEHNDGPGLRRVLLGVGALLAAALLFVAGWFVGRPSWPDDTSPDAGFARDMQVHHAQAVSMSLTVRSAGVGSDVQTLAYDIATTQENQRGQMRGWLEIWGLPVARSEAPMAWMERAGHGHQGGEPMLMPDGRMPGMASKAQLDRLASLRGDPAEVLYLQLMITHHRSGVTMAKACVSSCQQPDVVALARTMVEGQQAEIRLMTGMLRERGAPVPSA